MNYAPHLSYDYIQVQQDFSQASFGITDSTSRWQRCIKTMKWHFPEGMAAEFVRTHIGEGAKEKVIF